MKGLKYASLILALLAVLCVWAAPVYADGTSSEQTNKQGQTTSTALDAAEDPGGTNSWGTPPHGEWSGNGSGQASGGMWAPGLHPHEGPDHPPRGEGASTDDLNIWRMLMLLNAL